MVRDTACENCPFKSMGHDECPNYIETLWHEQGNTQPRIVKDCAPKRTLLMLQELHSKVFALQQQVVQQEGQILEFRSGISQLFSTIKTIEDEKKLSIQAKNKVLSRLQSMKGNHDNPIYTPSDCPLQIGD